MPTIELLVSTPKMQLPGTIEVLIWGLLGKYDDALHSFLKATTINSSFAEAWFNVGIAYDFFGEYNKAIEAYTRATEINPNYVEAQRKLKTDIDFVIRNLQMRPYP